MDDVVSGAELQSVAGVWRGNAAWLVSKRTTASMQAKVSSGEEQQAAQGLLTLSKVLTGLDCTHCTSRKSFDVSFRSAG